MQKAIVVILVLLVLGALVGDSDDATDREAEQQKEAQKWESPTEYNPNSADGTYDEDDSCSANPSCAAAREELEMEEIREADPPDPTYEPITPAEEAADLEDLCSFDPSYWEC